MTLSLAGVLNAAVDLLYPPRCSLCGRGSEFLCATCRAALPEALGARCDVCWMPRRSGWACERCSEHGYAFMHLRSAYRYEGEVRRLLHAFKFGGQSCLAPALAGVLIGLWQRESLSADVIVPVALTRRRENQRGYNQSALLAKELSKHTGVPVTEALSRKHTAGRHQADSVTAEERWRNVQGVFGIRRPDAIAGRRVLLVDDIATTGATLDACARALLDAGAREVSGVTLARED